LQSASARIPAFSLDELQHFVTTGQDSRLDHLYVADPNLGLWDAFRSALAGSGDMPEAKTEPASHVVFLQDDTSVLSAVNADARGLGLISSLTAPAKLDPFGVVTLPLKVTADAPPVTGGDSEVAAGAYPLYHYLYVACQADGSMQGGKFVTHVTSDRGQRQIARAGFVPSRLVLRQIYLTRHPVGQ
jgi:ABC-type phosphate transport system substrate-binding protein